MAYISFQPKDFFSPKIYTGNGTAIGSGGNAITGVGFQPDFTWIKNRDAADDNILTDAVRGATKYLYSNTASVEATNAEYLTTWGADGFTVGSGNPVNTNTEDFVSWNWKAGTTTGIAGSPTITPAGYSFNATSGFSVIKWAGTGSAGTLPHGLGVAPKWILVKRLEGSNWMCGHDSLGWTKSMVFNEAESVGTNTRWNDTNPTSTLFSLDGDTTVNNTGSNYIAYCFADVKGYSKFHSYIGTGNAAGPFVATGFRPAWVMIKKTTGESWTIIDDKRLGFNEDNNLLYANANSADTATVRADIVSNGFKVRTTNGEWNTDTGKYIYMAFAKNPIVSSNNIPGVAR